MQYLRCINPVPDVRSAANDARAADALRWLYEYDPAALEQASGPETQCHAGR